MKIYHFVDSTQAVSFRYYGRNSWSVYFHHTAESPFMARDFISQYFYLYSMKIPTRSRAWQYYLNWKKSYFYKFQGKPRPEFFAVTKSNKNHGR